MGKPATLRRKARNLRRASLVFLTLAAACIVFALTRIILGASPTIYVTLMCGIWFASEARSMGQDAKILDARAETQEINLNRQHDSMHPNCRCFVEPILSDRTGQKL